MRGKFILFAGVLTSSFFQVAKASEEIQTTMVESTLSGVFEGKFSPFAEAAEGDKHISGKAVMKANASGAEFKLKFEGLNKKEIYVSHVHALPCSVNNAGGHYKFDPTIPETREDNEIWFPVPEHIKSTKIVHSVSKALRSDAKSIVIHRMKNQEMLKVACADLVKKDR